MMKAAEMTSDYPWDDIQRDYTTKRGEQVKDLCARYGVPKKLLYARMKEEGWTPRVPGKMRDEEERPASPDMKAITELRTLVRKRITLLKKAEKSGDGGVDAVNQMTALARLMERLAVLEEKRRTFERKYATPRVINDARRLELARRIEAIQRQLEYERSRERANGTMSGQGPDTPVHDGNVSAGDMSQSSTPPRASPTPIS